MPCAERRGFGLREAAAALALVFEERGSLEEDVGGEVEVPADGAFAVGEEEEEGVGLGWEGGGGGILGVSKREKK